MVAYPPAANAFVREKDIKANKFYREVDVIPYTHTQQQAVRRRRTKKKITAPKQRDYNLRRAQRYFVQMVNANFWKGDLLIDLTYTPENRPATFEEAHHNAILFLERIARRRRALGLPSLKYALTTQEGEKSSNLHHHLVINGGVPREEIEQMWWKQKGTKPRAGRPGREHILFGWCNVRGAQPNAKGLAGRAAYMARASAGRKLWTHSQNLVKPDEVTTVDDTRYKRRDLDRIARLPTDCEEYRRYWETRPQYRGWQLVESRREYNELTGWAYYHVFSRPDPLPKRKRRRKGAAHAGAKPTLQP